MKKRNIALVLCISMIITLFCSCGNKKETDRIRFPVDSDPKSLDPQVAVGTSANIIINNCFEGLVRIGEGGKIIPGVAKDWKVSSDSLTYTFYLRPDAKWHLQDDLEEELGKKYKKEINTKVTAKDFVFAFSRALDPETNAPDAENLYAIKNAKAVHSGNMSTNKLGVTAIDTYTLQIKMEYPSLNFLSILTAPICMPCNEVFFNKTSGRYGLSSKLTLCNGPFYLYYWEKDSKLFLAKDDEYLGAEEVKPTSVRFYVNPDKSTYISNLSNEVYDSAPISSSDVSQLPSDMDFEITKYKNIIWSLCFNNKSKLLSDNNFRLALCHATNGNLIRSDSEIVAKGIVPSSCLLVPGTFYRENSGVVPLSNYNEQIALKYWNNYINNDNSPEVNLNMICIKEHKTLLKKLIQEWQKLFGIEFSVNIVTMEREDLQKRVLNGNYEIAFAPIYANEFLASDFLNRFGTDNYGNVANYSSKQYDSMLDNIRKAKSKKSLQSLCKNAEIHLINNGVIFPIFSEDSYTVVNSSVEGLYFYPSGDNVTFINAHHTS